MPENIIVNFLNLPQVQVKETIELPGKICEIHLGQEREWLICSECKRPVVSTYGGRQLRIRDLGIFEHKTYLVIYKYRVKCPLCGVKSQELGFTEPYSRCTVRFEDLVARLCRLMSVKAVAGLLELDRKLVKRIDKKYLKKEFDKIDCSGLKFIAVDEVASKKGHNYFTVVLDLEKTRVVWVGKGRKEETLNQFFAEIGSEISKQIEAVACDMWDPYLKSIRQNAPQAQPVFDKFHVLQMYSRMIDKARNIEYRKASKKGKEVIKGSRYLLLKNSDNLKFDEKEHLDRLLKLNRRLTRIYILKDELKGLWMYKSRGWAEKHLDRWISMARRSRIKVLKQFAKTLDRYREGLLAHCRYPIHSGTLEGFNNKIKVIKRVAYGFHDDEYFILKIKQACSGASHA